DREAERRTRRRWALLRGPPAGDARDAGDRTRRALRTRRATGGAVGKSRSDRARDERARRPRSRGRRDRRRGCRGGRATHGCRPRARRTPGERACRARAPHPGLGGSTANPSKKVESGEEARAAPQKWELVRDLTVHDDVVTDEVRAG